MQEMRGKFVIGSRANVGSSRCCRGPRPDDLGIEVHPYRDGAPLNVRLARLARLDSRRKVGRASRSVSKLVACEEMQDCCPEILDCLNEGKSRIMIEMVTKNHQKDN